MKIPSSKVPAEVWAKRAKKRGDGGLFNFEERLLSHWEKSKQVYRISNELWDALATEDGDKLPVTVLKRLPYDCLFLQRRWYGEHMQLCDQETANMFGEGIMEVAEYHDGCYCWIEGDVLYIGDLVTERFKHTDAYRGDDKQVWREIPMRVVVDEIPLTDGMTLSRYYALKEETIRNEQKMMFERGAADYPYLSRCNEDAINEVIHNNAIESDYLLRRVLGCLFYICSLEADVRTVYVPQRHASRKSRQTDCTVHEVGFRVAPKLAEVRRQYENEARKAKATGRHMPCHIRRAHWHGYWTGPKDNPTGLEIKWIAPIIVNADAGEVQGVIHRLDREPAAGIDIEAEGHDARDASGAMDAHEPSPALEEER